MITDTLPKPQVQASQLPVHISHFLQNCKKGKSSKKDLSLLKNDITGSELIVKILDTLQLSASDIDKKCRDVYEKNFNIQPVGNITENLKKFLSTMYFAPDFHVNHSQRLDFKKVLKMIEPGRCPATTVTARPRCSPGRTDRPIRRPRACRGSLA